MRDNPSMGGIDPKPNAMAPHLDSTPPTVSAPHFRPEPTLLTTALFPSAAMAGRGLAAASAGRPRRHALRKWPCHLRAPPPALAVEAAESSSESIADMATVFVGGMALATSPRRSGCGGRSACDDQAHDTSTNASEALIVTRARAWYPFSPFHGLSWNY